MKKKLAIIVGTCFFLAVSGICYSCNFKAKDKQKPAITNLEPKSEDTDAAGSLSSKAGTKSTKADAASSITEAESSTTEAASSTARAERSMPITPAAGSANGNIYVHLCGAVVKPDVYEVKSTARLVEVIELAGGLSSNAAGDYINQAMVVQDGQRIYIPTKDEIKELNPEEYIDTDNTVQPKQQETSQKININEADADELMSLPGIGQAKADSIIKYRNENGKFLSIEEIMNIPGIKEGMFKKISSYITI